MATNGPDLTKLYNLCFDKRTLNVITIIPLILVMNSRKKIKINEISIGGKRKALIKNPIVFACPQKFLWTRFKLKSKWTLAFMLSSEAVASLSSQNIFYKII